MKYIPEYEELIEGKEIYSWSFQDEMGRYNFAGQFVKEKTVLDIACGTGYGTKYLLRNGAKQVISGDISLQALTTARAQCNASESNFLLCDANNLPFPDHLFDVIVSFETIEHLCDGWSFLSECCRIMKDSGILIISTPNKNITSPFSNKPLASIHRKEYTPVELNYMLGNVFKDVCLFSQHNLSGWSKVSAQVKSCGGFVLEKIAGNRVNARKFGNLFFHKDYHKIKVPSVDRVDELLNFNSVPIPWVIQNRKTPGCIIAIAGK